MKYLLILLVFILSCTPTKNILLNDNFEVKINESLDINKNKKYYLLTGEISGIKKKKDFNLIASETTKLLKKKININEKSIKKELKSVSVIGNKSLVKVEVFLLKDSFVYSELFYKKTKKIN